jgi:type IV secretory pathway VirB2 component (pilin)
MKKTVKVLAILLLAIILIAFSANVFAAELSPSDLNDKVTYGDSDALSSKAGQIMGMIRNVSVIAAVIILMVLGVKYMLGSVEEKADYKKSFIPLIIGIILVVSATTIATFVFNMSK